MRAELEELQSFISQSLERANALLELDNIPFFQTDGRLDRNDLLELHLGLNLQFTAISELLEDGDEDDLQEHGEYMLEDMSDNERATFDEILTLLEKDTPLAGE